MIPAYEVADSIKAKRLDPSVFENFKEILNVCAQLFGGATPHPVRLGSVYAPADVVPDPVKKFIAEKRERKDVLVSIAGYGNGSMGIFC